MGRKSALTGKQWQQVGARLLKGEPGRVIACEFGISETAIGKCFGTQVGKTKDAANQVVATESAFKSLPIGVQIHARTLADKLKEISMHLAGAALYCQISHKYGMLIWDSFMSNGQLSS